MSDVDTFLAHYGVKGMRWGKRKGPVDKQGNLKTPSVGRAVLLGAVGNSKKRYTDPVALQRRTTAGKTFAVSVALGAATSVAQLVATKSSNPAVQTGAGAAAQLLNLGAAGVGIASLVQTGQSIRLEKEARARG